ncbi:MAG: MFS transporter [Dehalococcoidia bacterium]|nr:MFS transporter [Dehalococcoidia bacterium]
MLSRPFLTIAMSMFTATMGLGMVLPLLPVYATTFGASGATIGLTVSAFAIPQLLVSPFIGRWADRFGRKPFLLLGAAAYFFSAVGWWSADSLEMLILYRAISGIGSALIFSNAQAYVGDLAPAGSEGRYMGAFGVADFLGFGLGPLFAGVIRDTWGLGQVFLSMAVLYAVVFVLIWVLLPARPARLHLGTTQITAPWGKIFRHPTMQALMLLRTCFALATGVSMSFLAVHLEQSLATTATMVGLVFAMQQIVGGLSQPFLGRLADRFSRPWLVFAGTATMAAGLSTIAWTESYPLILLGVTVGPGLGAALANVSAQALQVDTGRDLGMATVASLGSASFAAGFLLGAIGGGRVVDLTSVPVAFLLGAAVMVFGGTVFLVRVRGIQARAAATASAAAAAVLDVLPAPTEDGGEPLEAPAS